MLVSVFLGGLGGGLARSALTGLDSSRPWTTLLVNLAGAFGLGAAVAWGRHRWSPQLLSAVSVGVPGSFTTFATMAADVWDLGDGELGGLVSYLGLSLVGGAALALAGARAGRWAR